MPQLGSTENPGYRWLESIWLLIALVTPLFINLWGEQQFEASKIWLLRMLVFGLGLFWLVSRLNGTYGKALPRSIRNSSAALVATLLLTTALSANHYIAIFGSLDRANGLLTQLCYFALFLCIATQIDPLSSRRLIQTMIITGIPICLLGFAQWAGWQPLPLYSDARVPLTTTLGRANFTGAYLSLVVPLTVAALYMAKNRRSRCGYGLLIAMEVGIIFLTQARAAWIATLVGTMVLLWLQSAPRFSARLRWISALAGILLFAGALYVIGQRGIAAGGSIAARWTIWQASLRLLWSQLWLGYGADTLEFHFPSVYPPQLVYYQGRGIVVDRAHNWLLDWSLNYGVIATLLLTGLVMVVLWQGWQRLMICNDIHARSLTEHSKRPTYSFRRIGYTAPYVPLLSKFGEKGERSTPKKMSKGAERGRRGDFSVLLSSHESTCAFDGTLEPVWLAACMAALCAHLIGNLFLFDVAATATVFWMLLGIIVSSVNPNERGLARLTFPQWLGRSIIVGSIFLIGWLTWESAIRPFVADVHSRRGSFLLSQRNPAAALAAYSAAARYQPYRTEYLVAMALTAAQNQNLRLAENFQYRAISLRPADPVLYTQLAKIYALGAIDSPEKLTQTYRAYDHAISLAPTIGLTYRQFADLAFRSGDIENALALAQQAVDLDATDGTAFGILGWTQLQSGNLAAAQYAFEQAVKWEPNSADFQLGLATVHFRLGDSVKARQFVEQSLQLDPAYEPSLTLQVQLE